MSFHFRLQTVLKVRQRERDVQQQLVAKARTVHAKCIADRNLLASHRETVIGELRSLNEQEAWSLDQVLHRQRHAEQLGHALAIAEATVVDASFQLESGIERLVIADQSVRALERLAERQFAEYQDRKTKSAARESTYVG